MSRIVCIGVESGVNMNENIAPKQKKVTWFAIDRSAASLGIVRILCEIWREINFKKPPPLFPAFEGPSLPENIVSIRVNCTVINRGEQPTFMKEKG